MKTNLLKIRVWIFVLALSLFSAPLFSADKQPFRITDCLTNLQKLFVPSFLSSEPSESGVSTTLRNLKDLQAKMAPFYLEKKPEGWEQQLKKAISSKFLAGNNGGAESYILADGSRVVAKSFLLDSKKFDDARLIVEQQKEWERNGEGAALKGVSVIPSTKTGEVFFKIVMEDITASQNSVGSTRSAGMGTEMHALRPYSQDSRTWVANRMLELLDKHPDPHPKNVFYRVTKLSPNGQLPPNGSYHREGDLIFQVLLIDATGGEAMAPDYAMRYGDPKLIPPIFLQYNRQFQADYFKKQLNLPKH